MAIWFLLISVGISALQVLLRKRPPRAPDATPEKFAGLTAAEGRPVPVLWGTRQVKNANVAWFGDLSQTAIVQSSVTTGWKYYMGAQYVICIGPVDEVVAVHWNDAPVGQGISAANNQLVIGIGPPPYYTAAIAPGNYPTGAALAPAVEAAMKAAQPGNWKVSFGFRIDANRNDVIAWGIKVNGEGVYRKRLAWLAPGNYSAAGLAAAIQTAMYDREVYLGETIASYSCSYNGGTSKFTLVATSVDEWALFGADDVTFEYSRAVNSTIGYRMDVSRLGVTNLIPDYPVIINRFTIAYGGTTAVLRLTDAAFTAATLLGFGTGADLTIGSATSTVDFAVIEASYTDQGDFIQVDLNDTDFFGTEGGVSGRLDVYKGSTAQAESGYLTAEWGSTAPAFRGVCYAVQRGMYVGDTNYPKPISFTVRRCPNGLGLILERHNIGGDANPACILWEVLTDDRWGLGIPSAQIDQAGFQLAGDTLSAEGLGLSLILDDTTTAADFVEEVLRHIDGVLFVDHVSGLISLRLVRNDYVVADLLEVNRDNTDSCKLDRVSYEETRNVVRVHFVDRDAVFSERVEQRQNLANIQQRNGDMSVEDVSFPGISNRTVAGAVAARELKVLGQIPAKVTCEGVNRELWTLRPGAPFRLSWQAYGVTDMPCRVIAVDAGELADGKIRIEAVQDLIGPAWTGFIAPTVPAPDPEET